MFQRNVSTALTILLIIVILAIFFRFGGDFLSYDCRQIGEAMHVNWMWQPMKGCFIQQPSGAWIPVDTNRAYTP